PVLLSAVAEPLSLITEPMDRLLAVLYWIRVRLPPEVPSSVPPLIAEAPALAVIKTPPVASVPPETVWLPELNRIVETVVEPDNVTLLSTSALPDNDVGPLPL